MSKWQTVEEDSHHGLRTALSDEADKPDVSFQPAAFVSNMK